MVPEAMRFLAEWRTVCCRDQLFICAKTWAPLLGMGGIWLVNGLKVRGSICWDIFHRLQCDLQDACSSAGLTIIRLEMATVLGLRRGPWGKEGNHDVLLGAAKEMFGTLSPQSVLLEVFYEELCVDLQELGPDVGTEEHYAKVWKLCEDKLVGASVGYAPKQSRWWAVECQARHQKPTRTMLSMLLTFVGFRRGWWKNLDQCPQLAGVMQHADIAEGADPNPVGLEPLEGAVAKPVGESDADAPSAAKVSIAQGRAEMRRRRSQ